jgi:hypothetical protein
MPCRREGSLLCHTCCETGPWFFQVSSEEQSHLVASYDRKRTLKTYSNSEPPHLVASYDTPGDAEDPFSRES